MLSISHRSTHIKFIVVVSVSQSVSQSIQLSDVMKPAGVAAVWMYPSLTSTSCTAAPAALAGLNTTTQIFKACRTELDEMGEDQCLIQYVRDNFGHDYINMDSSFGLEYNAGFAESGSPVTTLAPELFCSPSSPSSTEVPAGSAMESLQQETAMGGAMGCYSPPGEPGLQVPSVLQSNQLPVLDKQEYPVLASYGFAQSEQDVDFNGGGITLDEMLQEQFSNGGERVSWRGKTPAVLMQQLKGPSLSASSSSSEARSNQKSPTPLNLTSLISNPAPGGYTSFGAPIVSKPVSRQRSLPPLGHDHNVNESSMKMKNILSSPRVKQSTGTSTVDIKQRRKIMPGLTINNSWSSSSTSPGPSSNEKELLAANFDLLTASVSKQSHHNPMGGGDPVWKKAKPATVVPELVSEDAVQAAILATAMVEQKEKNELRDKFLALLQIDSSTPKDYKAQILDDTIRYLKDLRRRLNFHSEADSESHFFPDDASPTGSSRCRPAADGPVRLKDLELETAGVEISPHFAVESGPHIEVRMMENQLVMVKLTAKDRPGLFNDIVVVLRNLRLDIQHAHIRTRNNGQRHDVFAAKMQLPLFFSQSTHSIASALNKVISESAGAIPSASL